MLIRRDENSIDKLFRQKLHDAEEEVPLHLWEGIRSQTQKKNRRFFWFGILAALLAGITLTILWSDHSGVSNTAYTETAITGENQNNSATKNNNENTAHKQQSNPSEITAPVTSAGTIADDEATTGNQRTRSNLTVDSQSVPTDNVSKQKNSLNAVDSEKSRQKKKQRSGIISGFGAESKDKDQDNRSEVLSVSPVVGKNLQEIEQTHAGNSQPVVPSNADEPIAVPPFSQGTIAVIEEEVLKDETTPLALTAPLFQTATQNSGQWSVGFYGLLTAPFHDASAGHDPQQVDALLSRTTTHAGYGVGAMLNYRLMPQFSIGLGVEATSFRETHHWQDTTGYAGNFQTVNYEVTYPDPEGLPVVVMSYDTVYREEIVHSEHHMTNEYISVNIPLLLNWHKPLGKFWLGAEVGPVFRIHTRYNGAFVFARSGVSSWDETSFLPPLTNQFNISENSGENTYVQLDQYYTRWKTDLHIGLHFGYQFHANWSTALSAFYRQSAVIDKGNPLAHRMVQPGLKLGLNYHF
jgi:hypothetical protein